MQLSLQLVLLCAVWDLHRQERYAHLQVGWARGKISLSLLLDYLCLANKNGQSHLNQWSSDFNTQYSRLQHHKHSHLSPSLALATATARHLHQTTVLHVETFAYILLVDCTANIKQLPGSLLLLLLCNGFAIMNRLASFYSFLASSFSCFFRDQLEGNATSASIVCLLQSQQLSTYSLLASGLSSRIFRQQPSSGPFKSFPSSLSYLPSSHCSLISSLTWTKCQRNYANHRFLGQREERLTSFNISFVSERACNCNWSSARSPCKTTMKTKKELNVQDVSGY